MVAHVGVVVTAVGVTHHYESTSHACEKWGAFLNYMNLIRHCSVEWACTRASTCTSVANG